MISEDRTGRAIAVILRTGVVVSAVLIVFGVVVSFAQHASYRSSSSVRKMIIEGHTSFPHSFHALFHGLSAGSGDSIIVVGLLVLVFTPIARVAVSLLSYIAERDVPFVAITAFVLSMLVFSFFIGNTVG